MLLACNQYMIHLLSSDPRNQTTVVLQVFFFFFFFLSSRLRGARKGGGGGETPVVLLGTALFRDNHSLELGHIRVAGCFLRNRELNQLARECQRRLLLKL